MLLYALFLLLLLLPFATYLGWKLKPKSGRTGKLLFGIMIHQCMVFVVSWCHGPLTRYVKLRVAHAPGMSGTFSCHRLQRKPLVSDPGMHHGTCVTHVPWCMSGSLSGGSGENVLGIPGACATRNFTYLVRSPLPEIAYKFSFGEPGWLDVCWMNEFTWIGGNANLQFLSQNKYNIVWKSCNQFGLCCILIWLGKS